MKEGKMGGRGFVSKEQLETRENYLMELLISIGLLYIIHF